MEKILRPSKKWADIFPIAVLASVGVMIVGEILSGVILNVLGLKKLVNLVCGNEDVAAFMLQYISFIGIWAAVLLFMLIFKANRPMLREFGYSRKGNTVTGLLAGLLLGFLCNGVCVLISFLKGDIRLSFNGIDPVLIVLFFAAVFIQSGAEELIDRLYLYQKLRRRYRSPLVAIIGNSLVFAALHVFNPGFTAAAASQIFIVGVLFSLLVYYYDSLWCAMAFHAAWNFTQNLIFGLPNSGIVSAYSVFRLEAASARSGLFYNVNFGVEGSIGASIVLLIVAAAVCYINRGRGEKTDLWAQESQEQRTAEELL